MSFEALERRRQDTWPGIWLAPIGALLVQALLLPILGDPSTGWLARVAVLAASLTTGLAGLWSLLRAHAREVQYSETITESTSSGDLPDVSARALARPKRRGHHSPTLVDERPDQLETKLPESEAEASAEVKTQPPEPKPEPESWVARWDRHLVWWAAGEEHAKAYMVWALALGLLLIADVAVLLASV